MKWLFGVITVVLGGLAYLVLMAAGYSKEASKGSACLSNIKTRAIALQIYAEDFDQRFPNRDHWMDASEPYSEYKGSYGCPEFSKLNNPQLSGYCFNARLSNSKTPKNPETVPLVFESVNLAHNASGRLESLPTPGRHRGKNNIGYADGHAKAVTSR